jgi:hypothetical protein
VKENVQFTATRTMILDGFMAIVKCHDQKFLSILLNSAEMNFLCFLISFAFGFIKESIFLEKYLDVPAVVEFSSQILHHHYRYRQCSSAFMKKHFIQDYCKSLFDDVIFCFSPLKKQYASHTSHSFVCNENCFFL